MENYWDGCKPHLIYYLILIRAFVLMSFEYGLSSALNAVGFMHTLKFVFHQLGVGIPDWVFIYEINDVIQINPMACLLIAGLTYIMLKGIKESITLNNIFTIGILIFFLYCNILSVAIFDSSVS
jgi:amino acid transporter